MGLWVWVRVVVWLRPGVRLCACVYVFVFVSVSVAVTATVCVCINTFLAWRHGEGYLSCSTVPLLSLKPVIAFSSLPRNSHGGPVVSPCKRSRSRSCIHSYTQPMLESSI